MKSCRLLKPHIPVLGKLRQKHCQELKARLGDIMSSRVRPGLEWDPAANYHNLPKLWKVHFKCKFFEVIIFGVIATEFLDQEIFLSVLYSKNTSYGSKSTINVKIYCLEFDNYVCISIKHYNLLWRLKSKESGMVESSFSPSTREAGSGKSLWDWG